MDDNQKLITVGEFESGFDAELAKMALENAGIRCVITGEDIGAIKPYSSTPFNVELQVFETDAGRAKEILAEQESCGGEGEE